MISLTRITQELVTDLFGKLGTKRFLIIGSFGLALLEHEFKHINTTEFSDIDILCTKSLQKYCRPLYDYFKEKYNVPLSFNFYTPQYVGVEEVIQESSLVNINRFIIIPREKKFIYDSNTFESPGEILEKYLNRDIQFNKDCCIYYYRKLDVNLKQLRKYSIEPTDDIVKYLQKSYMYTTDENYIEEFYDSHTRYHSIPQEVYKERPEKYFMLYYPVERKFERKTYYVQSI